MLIGPPAQGLVVGCPGLPHRQVMVSLAHVVCAFSPLTEDCCCFSVCLQGKACALISLALCVCVYLHFSQESTSSLSPLHRGFCGY